MSEGKQLDGQVARLKELMARLGRLAPLNDPLASVARFEELGLSTAQFHLLMWLGFEGSLNMSTLAERLGSALPNATRLVDRLKRAGLVLRERDEQDRRLVRVRLSAKGTRVYQQIDGMLERRLGLFLSALPDEDRSSLINILGRLADRFSAAPPPQADGKEVE